MIKKVAKWSEAEVAQLANRLNEAVFHITAQHVLRDETRRKAITMEDKEPTCGVCGRRRSWGCGHTRSQERDHARHNRTKKHRRGACVCFGHTDCNPKRCSLAGLYRPGYIPKYQHAAVKSGRIVLDENGDIDTIDGKRV